MPKRPKPRKYWKWRKEVAKERYKPGLGERITRAKLRTDLESIAGKGKFNRFVRLSTLNKVYERWGVNEIKEELRGQLLIREVPREEIGKLETIPEIKERLVAEGMEADFIDDLLKRRAAESFSPQEAAAEPEEVKAEVKEAKKAKEKKAVITAGGSVATPTFEAEGVFRFIMILIIIAAFVAMVASIF